jgi:hypothetical protein
MARLCEPRLDSARPNRRRAPFTSRLPVSFGVTVLGFDFPSADGLVALPEEGIGLGRRPVGRRLRQVDEQVAQRVQGMREDLVVGVVDLMLAAL